MQNEKLLKLSDKVASYDKYNMGLGKMTGVVRITDEETGEVILQKKNIIVYRGRAFALEKIFNTPLPEDFNPEMHSSNNLDRTVCLFTVGSGGTSATIVEGGSTFIGESGNVFDPAIPSPLDKNLHNPVPFRTVDMDDITARLTDKDLEKYANPVIRTITDENGDTKKVIEYYSKVFEPMVINNADSESPTSTSLWKNNEQISDILEEAGVNEVNNEIITKNEIFKYITLKINTKDCRGQAINELGLQIAHYDENATVGEQYSEIELFSRITFPSEPLMSETKKLIIEYFVYA